MTVKGKSFNLKITNFKHLLALSSFKYPSLVLLPALQKVCSTPALICVILEDF